MLTAVRTRQSSAARWRSALVSNFMANTKFLSYYNFIQVVKLCVSLSSQHLRLGGVKEIWQPKRYMLLSIADSSLWLIHPPLRRQQHVTTMLGRHPLQPAVGGSASRNPGAQSCYQFDSFADEAPLPSIALRLQLGNDQHSPRYCACEGASNCIIPTQETARSPFHGLRGRLPRASQRAHRI